MEKNLLELQFYSRDLNRTLTIKAFFIELLATLWEEKEGFSGKRPFGNSNWEFDIIILFVFKIRLFAQCNLGLTVSATNSTAAISNNGTATVTAASGTAPYTYQWSNGATSQSISKRLKIRVSMEQCRL